MHKLLVAAVVLGSTLFAGCTGESADPADDNASLDPLPLPGKEDGEFHRGLPTDVDQSRTGVWTVRNQWQDTTTAEAKQAGMAWPANSGLTWDAKYSAWVKSLAWIDGVDGWSKTVQLTTPWGKTMPAPILECAETALFLRVTFAAWYGLPLSFEAVDGGKTVYFGHFGVRTQTGRYAAAPEYAVKYKDYSTKTAPLTAPSSWPHDSALRGRRIAGGEDDQVELHEGAVFGEYLDEIHINKRAAWFTIMVLDYLGSMNLADSANSYNLLPEAVHPGDFLIERWQKDGIGHTLVVKEVTPVAGTEVNLDVTTISGSMPRRQGEQQSGASSKSYFTSDYTGGLGNASDGTPYAKLGGGLKRFRVAKARNGYWTNTWMTGDEANWINSTDYARIAARPARFESLLGEVSPDQLKAELLKQIDDARHHLAQYPASCSARETREKAFQALYALEADKFGRTQEQVDQDSRTLEDYVFAELDYTTSKTCCWDSSTAAMHDLIVDEAKAELAAAEANGTCIAPPVFMNEAGTGYGRWASYAAMQGKSAQWKAWSEDEPCAQRDVAADTQEPVAATDSCALDLAN